jgi:LmbE family N-acetylglucosaminyl deacetylase
MRRFLKNIINLIWSKKRYKYFMKKQFNDIERNHLSNLINALYFENHVKPIEIKIPQNKNILVISPHPDDETLGCGGLILQAVKKKCNIHILSLSSGSPEDANTREKELTKSANDLGVKDITFMRLTDGVMGNEIIGKNILNNLCSKYKPDIILTPFILDNHEDHKNANKLLLELKNHEELEIWCYQVYSNIIANAYCDITSVSEMKYKILENYSSQLKYFDYINWNKGLNAWNSRLSYSKDQKYIESYFISPPNDYIKLCRDYFNNNE